MAETQSASEGAKRGVVALLVMTATAGVLLAGIGAIEKARKKRRRNR